MKINILSFFILLLVACGSDDSNQNNNQFIPNISFDTGNVINTSLPQYSALQLDGNFVVLHNYGVNGIVVSKLGTSVLAFELTDPSHVVQGCSTLTVDGTIATCSCEDNAYFIFTGGPTTGTDVGFNLKPYFVTVTGNIIRVYNN